MPDTTETLDGFIARHALGLELERVPSNPHMTDMPNGRHWLATITRDGSSMAVYFSQGSGHTKPPTLDEILDCLASDAATVENARSFDEWADELGYFPMDSSAEYRRAQDAYQAINRQADELRELLGAEALETLMYGVERL